ncbi:MAG: DNA polymerase IV, partial [Acidobacteriota bacterium]
PNRLVAKIASDYHKPDGLTVVRPKDVRRFLDPMPVRRLHGVGPATEARLAEMGIKTIADLREKELDELRQRFGRHGSVLWHYARGLDDRPVRTQRERKSLGHERTYAQDLATLEQMEGQIAWLSERVAEGLQKKELRGRTVTLKVRYPDFTTLTRARTLPFAVDTTGPILTAALELLKQTDAGRGQSVRLLGVTASSLEGRDEQAQLELWSAA